MLNLLLRPLPLLGFDHSQPRNPRLPSRKFHLILPPKAVVHGSRSVARLVSLTAARARADGQIIQTVKEKSICLKHVESLWTRGV